ncbi:MAG: hypothetical protein AB1Z19_08105, partial [Eubacteriales bacterium]
MMKKFFKQTIDFLNKDVAFIGILVVAFLAYGLNDYLNLILVGVMFALLLANITNNRLFYAYFACIFFEPVLVLPFV